MSNNTNKVNPLYDQSTIKFYPTSISGEMRVQSDDLVLVFTFDARLLVNSYIDYDGYETTEFEGIDDLEISYEHALSEDHKEVKHQYDKSTLPAVETFIRELYANTDPDLGKLEGQYKAEQEGM